MNIHQCDETITKFYLKKLKCLYNEILYNFIIMHNIKHKENLLFPIALLRIDSARNVYFSRLRFWFEQLQYSKNVFIKIFQCTCVCFVDFEKSFEFLHHHVRIRRG